MTISQFKIPVTQQLLFIIIHWGTGNNSHLIFENNHIILHRDSFLNNITPKRQEKIQLIESRRQQHGLKTDFRLSCRISSLTIIVTLEQSSPILRLTASLVQPLVSVLDDCGYLMLHQANELYCSTERCNSAMIQKEGEHNRITISIVLYWMDLLQARE